MIKYSGEKLIKEVSKILNLIENKIQEVEYYSLCKNKINLQT